MPPKTSPDPAVANVGGALALMIARPFRGRDYRISAFQDNNAATSAGSSARAGELVPAWIEQPTELRIVWRQNAGPDDRSIELGGIVLEGRDCVCVEQSRSRGLKHLKRPDTGVLARTCAGTDQKSRETIIGQQAGEVLRLSEWFDHDAGQRRRVDWQSDRGHRDCRQPSPGAGGCTGRHPGSSGHWVAAGDQSVAAGVLVAAVTWPRKVRSPEFRTILESIGANVLQHG
jgi:hypothetical protein